MRVNIALKNAVVAVYDFRNALLNMRRTTQIDSVPQPVSISPIPPAQQQNVFSSLDVEVEQSSQVEAVLPELATRSTFNNSNQRPLRMCCGTKRHCKENTDPQLNTIPEVILQLPTHDLFHDSNGDSIEF